MKKICFTPKTIYILLFILTTITGISDCETSLFESNRISKTPIYSLEDINMQTTIYHQQEESSLLLGLMEILEDRPFNRNSVLRADIYSPPTTHRPRPMVIWAHGGANVMGKRTDASMELLSKILATHGLVTASIDYSLVDLKTPGLRAAGYRAMQEIKAAVAYFTSNASSYGIDPDAIFIGGYSSGAIASLHAAFLEDEEVAEAGLEDIMSRYGCTSCLVPMDQMDKTQIKGVINIAGAVIDTDIIDEHIPLISFHGAKDEIVDIQSNVPFGDVGQAYNDVAEEIEYEFNRADLALGNLFNKIVRPTLPELHGSIPIHAALDAIGSKNKLVIFENAGHHLITTSHGQRTDLTQQIIHDIISFMNTTI